MKRLTLAVAVAVGILTAAPAVAQAPPINLAVSKPSGGPVGTTTTVLFGELVRVSGELTNGRPNETVTLTVSPYRGPAQTVTLRTDSTGEFTYTHRPRVRTSYTARWNNQASNQEPFAHVRPKVGLRVINARAGQFRVTMQAVPQHVSRVVWVQRRITRTRWANIKRVQLRNRNLSAAFTVNLPRGVQRVRIFVPATPGYLRTTSAFVRVTR